MKNKEVDIQFVGHSTFILDDKQGTRILIDPWLKNNPACPEDLQEPKDIDYILITHGHFDHIGDLFAAIDINKEAKIVTSLEVSSWLNAKGISNTLPMGIGGSQPLDNDIKVVMVNAVHASGIADDKSESMLYGGVANGYVVEFKNGFSSKSCAMEDHVFFFNPTQGFCDKTTSAPILTLNFFCYVFVWSVNSKFWSVNYEIAFIAWTVDIRKKRTYEKVLRIFRTFQKCIVL